MTRRLIRKAPLRALSQQLKRHELAAFGSMLIRRFSMAMPQRKWHSFLTLLPMTSKLMQSLSHPAIPMKGRQIKNISSTALKLRYFSAKFFAKDAAEGGDLANQAYFSISLPGMKPTNACLGGTRREISLVGKNPAIFLVKVIPLPSENLWKKRNGTNTAPENMRNALTAWYIVVMKRLQLTIPYPILSRHYG